VDVVEPVRDVSGSCEVWYGWCDRLPNVARGIKNWVAEVRLEWLKRQEFHKPVAIMRNRKVKV
jgi:hypothetical protein